MVGFSELLVLIAVIVIVVNLRKMGELAGSIGKSVKIFKKALHEEEDNPTHREVEEYKGPKPPA